MQLFVTAIPADTDRLHLFLLVCGLRRVKDPLYLVEVFSGKKWLFEYSCFVTQCILLMFIGLARAVLFIAGNILVYLHLEKEIPM